MHYDAKKGERAVKKEYEKPMAEIIEFVFEERIMDTALNPDDDEGLLEGSSVEEW